MPPTPVATQLQPSIGLKEDDKAGLFIVFGDRSKDGKLDVTIELWGDVPLDGSGIKKIMTIGPLNIPVEEALKIAAGGIGLLPPPMNALAPVVQGAITIALHAP